MTEPDIDEALLRAQGACQTGLRLEPEIQRDDIDIMAAIEPVAGNLCRPHAAVAAQFVHPC